MPRKATGTVVWDKDHYKARITLKDGTRPYVHFRQGLSKEEAEAKAKAASDRARRENRVKVQRGAEHDVTSDESMEDWCGRWLADREARGYTDTDNVRWTLGKYVWKRFGDDPMAAITRDDLESIVEDLDRLIASSDLSWKTAANAWSVVTTMFADAVSSKTRALRVLTENPCLGVRGPDRGGKKAKSYLYPNEFLQVVASKDVPLADRRLIALAVYFFVRPGELEALQWEDIDLEHQVVDIHSAVDRKKDKTTTTKTETPRRNPIEPTLMPLLKVMHREAGGTGRVAPPMLAKLAPFLHRCLEAAKVKRAVLFANTKTQKRITFYDLRATGITWMAVRGDKPEVIKRRAGHNRYETTEGYIREAENLDPATFGIPFPPLPRSLLGLPDDPESSPESSSGGRRNASRPRKQGARRGGGAGNRTRVRKIRGHLRLRAYPAVWIVPICADWRALLGTIHLFDLASAPVTRTSASQFVDGLPRAPASPWVDRLSDLLFRQRGQLRYRSQLCFPRGFYVVPRDPRHAARWSKSPSKPIAPMAMKHEAA